MKYRVVQHGHSSQLSLPWSLLRRSFPSDFSSPLSLSPPPRLPVFGPRASSNFEVAAKKNICLSYLLVMQQLVVVEDITLK